MPAASNVITAAGTQFAVSATLPLTHDVAGFAALTFTDVAEVVDGGSAGKTFNKVDHSPLGEREVLSLKGSFTQGIRSLQLGRDISDAGQTLLLAGLDVDDAYAFRVTYQNGDIDYFTSTIDSYTDDIGTIDTIVGSTVSLAQCQATVRVLGLGVLTASINDAGTTYDTDGTFPATQLSTDGAGTGAEFTVTIATGVVTTIDSVDNGGSAYQVGDLITLSVTGSTPATPAVLSVDTVG